MPYPRKLLNDYETVALDLHPHWWYFVEPVSALIGSIVLGIVSMTLGGDVGKVLGWIAVVAIVASVAWLAIWYIRWTNTYFVITSDRVIFKHGVVSRSGIEIPLERVNNVLFNQSMFERIVGLGDLLIESGGEVGQQRFTDIKDPERVQNLIHSQMEVNEYRRFQNPADRNTESAGAAAAGPSDVATQLERLEALMERGSLTRDEFDQQKRRLLEG